MAKFGTQSSRLRIANRLRQTFWSGFGAALLAWVAPWIAFGAPGVSVGENGSPRVDGIREEHRTWWAFQPLSRPVPPRTQDTSWGRNPIDAFVLHRLETEGLRPSPEADRRTFIRRLYFDTHGLAPTSAQIETFLQDDSLDAYETLVNEALESPHYGERMARHWLDLVRYAESDGYKADEYRPDVWRYRDYVIQAFNSDKPYDQFIREQLAGDELAPGDPETVVATTFLRLWIYEYNNRDAKGQWETILNDLTDITGDVFLGLGISCARCHDHKFDPILQKDYYRLQAFFAPILPREDIPVANQESVTRFRQRQEAWEATTRDIRAEMHEILKPYLAKAAQEATSKFPEDIQALLAIPPGERSPYQRQVAELAYRQITYEQGLVESRLKDEDKNRYQELKNNLAQFDLLRPEALPASYTVTDVGPESPPTYLPKGHSSEAVPPGFLTLFEPGPATIARSPAAPNSTGRRTALAHWLTRRDHPLTARVMVNRLWQQYFGAGIVSSASDFGRLGHPPTHPELLDWLATQLVSEGWSLKRIHRLILSSATYRQSSTAVPSPNSVQRDPENRWLWRMPTRRLDAEQIRDAILAASGELNLDMGGPAVEASEARRSIYTKRRRNTHDPLLEAFDQPDGINSTPRRNITTTPTQALLLFNNESVNRQAHALGERIRGIGFLSPEAQIAQACQWTFGRQPETWETAEWIAFLDGQAERIAQEQRLGPGQGRLSRLMPEELALDDLCHVLLNANEFLYVD